VWIVVLSKRRNRWLLLSERKHFRKNSCAASCPFFAAGAVPNSACSLFDSNLLLYSTLPLLLFLKCSWWLLSPSRMSCLHTMQHLTEKTRKQVNNTRRSALAS
jgi:hypothetical protein